MCSRRREQDRCNVCRLSMCMGDSGLSRCFPKTRGLWGDFLAHAITQGHVSLQRSIWTDIQIKSWRQKARTASVHGLRQIWVVVMPYRLTWMSLEILLKANEISIMIRETDKEKMWAWLSVMIEFIDSFIHDICPFTRDPVKYDSWLLKALFIMLP